MKTIYKYQGKILKSVQLKNSLPEIEYLFLLLQADDARLYWIIRDRKAGQEVAISIHDEAATELTDKNINLMMADFAEMLAYTNESSEEKMKLGKKLITKLKKAVKIVADDNQVSQ